MQEVKVIRFSSLILNFGNVSNAATVTFALAHTNSTYAYCFGYNGAGTDVTWNELGTRTGNSRTPASMSTGTSAKTYIK